MEKIYNKKKDKEDVHLTGVVEAFYANDFAFQEQHQNYKNWGFAKDPTDHSTNLIISTSKPEER